MINSAIQRQYGIATNVMKKLVLKCLLILPLILVLFVSSIYPIDVVSVIGMVIGILGLLMLSINIHNYIKENSYYITSWWDLILLEDWRHDSIVYHPIFGAGKLYITNGTGFPLHFKAINTYNGIAEDDYYSIKGYLDNNIAYPFNRLYNLPTKIISKRIKSIDQVRLGAIIYAITIEPGNIIKLIQYKIVAIKLTNNVYVDIDLNAEIIKTDSDNIVGQPFIDFNDIADSTTLLLFDEYPKVATDGRN